MVARALVVVVVLMGLARAETFNIYPGYGWGSWQGDDWKSLSISPKPCADAKVGRDLERLLLGGIKLRITANQMLVTPYGQAKIALDKSGTRTGVWNLGPRSLVIAIDPEYKSKVFPGVRFRQVRVTLIVEADAVERSGAPLCYERWSGMVEL